MVNDPYRARRVYVLNGVRPSSGTETLENDPACEMSDRMERGEMSASLPDQHGVAHQPAPGEPLNVVNEGICRH